MITGSLQQKNGYYYAVLYLKVDGKRKCKWIPTKLPVNGTSNRKAQKAFDEIRIEYEREQEERQRMEEELAELTKNTHPDALLPFTDYIEKWLHNARPSLATTTYQSYSNMIKARILPLIPAVEKLLLEEKEKQEMFRRLFKKSYCRDYLDYICVDQTGKILRPNYVTEHFAWLIQKYDLKKVRFHDLRHTCASLLLSNGISMKQIQIWLGHSTFATTADIYAHLDFAAQEESANAMNGMFVRATAEQPA